MSRTRPRGGAERINAADEILGPPLASGCADRPALMWDDRQLTFRELDEAANRAAHALLGAGVVAGARVLFVMDDSPELVAAYLGAMRIGAVSVALNVRLAPQDLAYVLDDAAAPVLIAHEEFLPLCRDAVALAAQPIQLFCAGAPAADDGDWAALVATQPATRPAVVTRAGQPAFWIYSSGTTGQPKAAVHLHRDVCIADRHLHENLGVEPGSRVFTTSKMFFAFALGHSLFGALRCGAAVLICTGWPDPARVAGVVEALRPTVMLSVPTMYRNLLRDGLARGPGFGAVRHYVSAGERLPESVFEKWMDATGRPILEGIGTSETVFLAIANTPVQYRAGSCGRPLPWVEARLVDDAGAPVTAPDTPARLALRMASTFAGYWNRPELSRRALRDGWYLPGDVFSRDAQGWWYHHGRDDDMLKISGQWVSPAEIEECALTLPELQDVAVVGTANADGLVRLALFAVPADPNRSPPGLADRIVDTLRARLSIYKCPRSIHIVPDLPRTVTGKIQKYLLRQVLEHRGEPQ